MPINNKLATQLAVKSYDFDPDSADPTAVAWVDMRDFDSFLAVFCRTVGTGAMDSFKIQGSTASNGANPVDIVTKTISSEPDAVGDNLILECGKDDIIEAGENLRYVALVPEFATSTDEGVVTYIRGCAHRKYDGLTADSIS